MIEIILVLACCCFIFIVVLAGWFLNRGEEGDECEGKDKNGTYEIDEDLKCVLKSCDTGYYKSGKKCLVDQSGVVCVPTGTPDPQGTYLKNRSNVCTLSSCATGYVVNGTTCNPDPTAPTPDMLEDGQPYAYEAGKLYECTSGKDVGCLYRAEANGIAAAAGMYDPVGKTCTNGDHVYCVNDKTVTMAEYSDNTAAGTGAWNETMHRYAASGKACPTPESAKCQDDQSIASYQGWGGGNSAKITTNVTERQCVDNAFLYC